MKEIMIYSAYNDSKIVWGIYKRKENLNWTCCYKTTNFEMNGLINTINFALENYKDCKILFGGYWLNHEQLNEKRNEILNNI